MRPAGGLKGAAQDLAQARQQLARANASNLPIECITVLEDKVREEEPIKKAQPLGQKMDQARARLRRAVESGEKALEVLQKAQESLEQVQQEVIGAQTDLENLTQQAHDHSR